MEILEEKVYCRSCQRDTNQDIIMSYSEKSNYVDDDLQWICKYHITKCRGCDTPAFVIQYGDEDQWDFDNEGQRFWYDTFTVYPENPNNITVREYKRKLNAIETKEFKNVPETINNLYRQIIEVYNHEALLLGTVGIRTIIEAICLDVGINEGYIYEDKNIKKLSKKDNHILNKSLEGKIFGLYEHGFIIWEQTIILQKIRDIGNAAVHEIKEPSISVFKIAIRIVEDVLNNVYELKVNKLLKK